MNPQVFLIVPDLKTNECSMLIYRFSPNDIGKPLGKWIQEKIHSEAPILFAYEEGNTFPLDLNCPLVHVPTKKIFISYRCDQVPDWVPGKLITSFWPPPVWCRLLLVFLFFLCA